MTSVAAYIILETYAQSFQNRGHNSYKLDVTLTPDTR